MNDHKFKINLQNLEDITDSTVSAAPEGRDLTQEEETTVSGWPESNREYFRLAKKYGDPLKIPQEDLDRIHALALKELPTVTEEIEEPECDPSELDYELLWKHYPKRNMPMDGYRQGMEVAKSIVKNKKDFNKALVLIKNYSKQFRTPDERKYIKFFGTFLRELGDYGLKVPAVTIQPSSNNSNDSGSRKPIQKSWARPLRPAFSWEKDQSLGRLMSKEDQDREEEELKQKEGYYDQTNAKWWYYL